MKFLQHLISKTGKGEGNAVCIPCLAGAIVVLVIAILAISMILRSGGGTAVEELPLTQESVDDIVQHGQVLLTERLNAGDDLSDGPCLDNNKTFKGWVIDIAHDPRELVDDKAENQCSAYRRGSAKNFVELSLSGDIIRVYPEPPTTPEVE